jgi:hypothetical protein
VVERRLPADVRWKSVDVPFSTVDVERQGVGDKWTGAERVTWRVFQFGIIAGRTIPYPVGSMQGDYCGFVRVDDRRVKRKHAMFQETAAQRGLDAHQLQRQLDQAKPP